MMSRFQAVLLCGVSVAFGAFGAGKCNADIPLQWEIRELYADGTPNAIRSDGSLYIHGVNGVERSVINVCSGSYDATLLLARTPANRSISLSFAKRLATNGDTPTWAATGQTITGKWFLNIPHLLAPDKDLTQEFDFTGRLSSTGPTSDVPHVRMLNPDSYVGKVPGPEANSPYPNSLVNVHHCPADPAPPITAGLCAGITAETWFIWPDPAPTADGTPFGYPITQVASLILDGKRGARINAGEFSIPFYIVISRLQ